MFLASNAYQRSACSYQNNENNQNTWSHLTRATLLLVVLALVLLPSLSAWAQTSNTAAEAEAEADDEAEEDAPAPLIILPRPSVAGNFIIDGRAKLAWARCVEGMTWNGQTCTGQPRLMSYTEAQTLIKVRNQTENARWRLPRVNELRRLVNRSAKPPSVDEKLFPAAPRQWHWTGTASVNANAVNPYSYGTVQRGGAGASSLAVRTGWAVDMASGQGEGKVSRNESLVVRLVRPATSAD